MIPAGQLVDSPAFSWWDDAIDVAAFRAHLTGVRQRVRGWRGQWIVEEVDTCAG